MARQAGGFRPLVETARTDTARIESIPGLTTLAAKPSVICLRRPTAFRTSNSWAARAVRGRFLQFEIRGDCCRWHPLPSYQTNESTGLQRRSAWKSKVAHSPQSPLSASPPFALRQIRFMLPPTAVSGTSVSGRARIPDRPGDFIYIGPAGVECVPGFGQEPSPSGVQLDTVRDLLLKRPLASRSTPRASPPRVDPAPLGRHRPSCCHWAQRGWGGWHLP
jgi:hypothetical protein